MFIHNPVLNAVFAESQPTIIMVFAVYIDLLVYDCGWCLTQQWKWQLYLHQALNINGLTEC